MVEEFWKRTNGQVSHQWQLNVAEALHLGLDGVLIAGTGVGKTIPCMLPLCLPKNSKKQLFVISPLNHLEENQMYLLNTIFLYSHKAWHC